MVVFAPYILLTHPRQNENEIETNLCKIGQLFSLGVFYYASVAEAE